MPLFKHCLLVLAFATTASVACGSAWAEDAETVEVKAQDLKLTVPKSWKQQQPSNNLRLAQFQIPAVEGAKGDTELVVFPPFGGSKKQNVDRWIGQFDTEGRTVKTTGGTSTAGEYIFVDLTGTYKLPEGPPIAQKTRPAPDYRMLAVILTSPQGGNYFLKLVGPAKTVEANAEAFRKSFGSVADDEKPVELTE